jgi:hypothetical protein
LRLVAARQFGELLVEPLVDGPAINGHLDVLLARPDVLDIDRLLKLYVRIDFGLSGRFGAVDLGDGRGRDLVLRGVFGRRGGFVGHRGVLRRDAAA